MHQKFPIAFDFPLAVDMLLKVTLSTIFNLKFQTDFDI